METPHKPKREKTQRQGQEQYRQQFNRGVTDMEIRIPKVATDKVAVNLTLILVSKKIVEPTPCTAIQRCRTTYSPYGLHLTIQIRITPPEHQLYVEWN